MWSITCGSKQHPFPGPLLEDIRQILHPGHRSLRTQQGTQTGSTLRSLPQAFPPGVWPLKSELAGEDPVEAPLDDPKGHHNYPSAADFSKEIRATFEEEVPLGMTVGPLSRQKAAELCECDPTELCPGPLAGIDEGDKVRTIYDGSVGGANAKVQQNTIVSMPSIGFMPPNIPRPEHVPGLVQEPLALNGQGTRTTQPQPGTVPPKDSQWILLKADVTKAHRRIKVLPQDWRFQVAQLEDEWWVNKVGAYGMASAQLYWGSMAALLLRILYYLFPQIDWGFVFVDDFCWLLRLPTGPQFTAALLGTLVALGTPLSWKKTHLAEINTWLGFVIHPAIPRVRMAAPKHIKVMELLEELANGAPMSAKAIEKAMGRIQWATACCPLTKSMLQPLWAWKMAVRTMGHPPKVVRMLASLLKELFTHPFEQYSPFLPKSPWWGCSDASASRTW